MLAYSPIADDPRVRRMGDSLRLAGFDVVAIGLGDAISTAPNWQVIECGGMPMNKERADSYLSQVERACGKAGGAFLLFLARAVGKNQNAGRFLERFGKVLSRSRRPVRATFRQIGRHLGQPFHSPHTVMLSEYWNLSPALGELRKRAAEVRDVDLWIANDWWTLPIAAAVSHTTKRPFVYDSHELATEEYAERSDWVETMRPLISEIEKSFIRQAAIVTSVSPRISDLLRKRYDLGVPVLTLRNVPFYQESPLRTLGDKIGVLYHGIIAPGRGLESVIQSLRDWPERFHLTVRGPFRPREYEQTLLELAAKYGVKHRLAFVDPVGIEELVTAAQPYDIGILALPGHSSHNLFALPNKIFEYMMAGLALAVTDLPELSDLVKETGAGFSLGDGSAGSISSAIAALEMDSISKMRAASLEAAKSYHLEKESVAVIEAYRRLAEAV